jgi:hypothetical protein
MITKSKRAAIELSFSWIFAIIAGTFIILMAIYATTRFVQTSQYAQYSESAKNLGNLLNPVVNGVTSAYSTRIEFKKTTRIYLGCYETSTNSPLFGRQTIAFSEESGFLKKWTNPGANITRYNKYIFSDSMEQGKKFYIFSKPFYAGYRVDDLVYLTAKKYCFVGMPDSIKEEIESINPGNFNISNNIQTCKDMVGVCFGFTAPGCNISVMPSIEDPEDYSTGMVKKDDNSALQFYGPALMYAAIFSSSGIYECNIKRLGNKIFALGQIYKEEVNLVKAKNCNSVIPPYIENIQRLCINITSLKLKSIYTNAKLMDNENCRSDCRIYAPEKC